MAACILPLTSIVAITLNGSSGLFSGIDPSYKDEILNRDGTLKQKYSEKINLESLPFLNTEYLGFLLDGTSETSGNIYLRKAINSAVDKDKMLKYFRNNVGIAANNGFIPKGLPSFSDNLLYEKNKTGYPKVVEKLELNFKNIFKAKFCISTNSGTSALFASFYSLKLNPGDEIIVPNITFQATATPLLNLNCKIVFDFQRKY